MAARSDPVFAVLRVGPVYTPPGHRNCGYASALVATVSSAVRTKGQRCILYTDLGNPTSNAIYRAISGIERSPKSTSGMTSPWAAEPAIGGRSKYGERHGDR